MQVFSRSGRSTAHSRPTPASRRPSTAECTATLGARNPAPASPNPESASPRADSARRETRRRRQWPGRLPADPPMKLTTLGATALLGLLLAPLISGCGNLSPSRAALTATGYVSHQLCTAVFLSGQDAARNYRDAIEPVAGPFAFLMRHTVDRERAQVRATVAGL